MKISSKLIGFSLGTAAVVAGLAITLVGDIKSVANDYNKVLQGPVREAAAARVIQVDFKKQVQEWKDILLRGQNPADLAKYTAQFHAQEAKVRAGAQSLAETVKDPEAKQSLNDFVAADGILSRKYQAAYDIFLASNFDFKAADKLVRGQDRPATDLFDKAVAQLNARMAAQVAAGQAQAMRTRNIALGVAGALLLLVAISGFLVLHGVLARLGQLKEVSDKLARAEIEGLSIDISGNDEVGEFGQSLKGVAAALRELLAMASA